MPTATTITVWILLSSGGGYHASSQMDPKKIFQKDVKV